MRRLGDLGEHPWIERLVRRLGRAPRGRRIVLGAGDDTAILAAGRRPLLLTVDSLLEGVHFRRAWMTPRALGARAFAVNASDVAAMGGVPLAAVLALEAPGSLPVGYLDRLVDGLAAAARRAGAALVGGNVTSARQLGITVALLGEAPGRIVTRAGARAGDRVYVTGTLGGMGIAVQRLTTGRRIRLPAPPNRLRAGRLLASVAHAMIDVSDGALQDLGHVCRASGLAAEIELDRLPVAPACRRALGPGAAAFALTAGEDYELMATVGAAQEPALRRLRSRLGCPLIRIGTMRPGRPRVVVVDGAGRPLRVARTGFDHFR